MRYGVQRGRDAKSGRLYDINECAGSGGIVDYVVGTPLTKVYCLAEHPDPKHSTICEFVPRCAEKRPHFVLSM